jgi:hypothetical protein
VNDNRRNGPDASPRLTPPDATSSTRLRVRRCL